MALSAAHADNTLTDTERNSGWQLLFDGKTLDGWMTSESKPSKRPVEDGCINPHRCGHYGEKVNHIDLGQFTRPYKRPDGTSHKFDIAYKKHPRTGYIGLPDHGSDC